jgi:hypothetical protein
MLLTINPLDFSNYVETAINQSVNIKTWPAPKSPNFRVHFLHNDEAFQTTSSGQNESKYTQQS